MAERYIVVMRVGGKWVKTTWTDRDGLRSVYVGKAKAKQALTNAKDQYPGEKYKLVTAAELKGAR